MIFFRTLPPAFALTIALTLPCAGSIPPDPPEERPVVTVLDIAGDWETNGDLPWQAMLISLQGLANRQGPNIYLLYPENHTHGGTKQILEYYRTRHGIRTTTITSVEQAVKKYRSSIKACVVWDTEVLSTLMVAYTIAGLEDALVVTRNALPLMRALHIPVVADLSGRFRGKTDAEIFQWAYDTYWPRCSRDYLVYLGEYCRGLNNGPGIRPAVADFAILHGAFCSDLSARPGAGAEYALAERIMSEMRPYAQVYGWHSYCKDKEEEHITMVSRHALVMAEGLASLPNMSFHSRVPVSPDFRFVQRGQFDPTKNPGAKVYLTLIESDGLGIGSWNRPGRGAIPYGWEMNEEYYFTAPALLQYYYESATPNDHFIGSLSGPGYFYPKAFPPGRLPGVLQREDSLMRLMDLHVFGIMDFSEGDHAVGNADLTASVADAYYTFLPAAEGFLNGYGPANTYDCRAGRPLLSYNYYVDKKKSEGEVAEDLRELARLNPRRPYFLPVHVREDNDVGRMKRIVDLLGTEFEVLPPREFMRLAGKSPTMTTRYLVPFPDFSGRWKLDPALCRNTFPSSLELQIDHRGNLFAVTTTAIEPRYVHHRERRTSKTLIIGGPAVPSLEEMTRRMGYSAGWSDSVLTSAFWNPDGRTLSLKTQLNLETSQGRASATSMCEYSLSADLMTLTVRERRSTRLTDEPAVVFVYRRVL